MASYQSNTADMLRRLGLDAQAPEGHERPNATRERLVQENPELMTYGNDLAMPTVPFAR